MIAPRRPALVRIRKPTRKPDSPDEDVGANREPVARVIAPLQEEEEEEEEETAEINDDDATTLPNETATAGEPPALPR